MTTIIRSVDRTITSEEVIFLLNKYGLLSRLAYEDIIDRAVAHIECTPPEIAIASKLWQHSHKSTSPNHMASAIRKLKIEKFKQQAWGDRIPAYFARRKKQLDRVIYSSIEIETKEIAREIYFRLIEGEQTFAELARECSENSQMEVNNLGWLELGTLPSPIARQLSTLEVNSFSTPLLVGNCYVILRLEKYVSAQCDRAMRKRLINELFSQWIQQQLTQQKYHLENVNSLQ